MRDRQGISAFDKPDPHALISMYLQFLDFGDPQYIEFYMISKINTINHKLHRLTFLSAKTADAIAIIGSRAGLTFADSACVFFRFYREVDNDNSLILWQEWEC